MIPKICMFCAYLKQWVCLKHQREQANIGPICEHFADTNKITVAEYLELRRKAESGKKDGDEHV